MIWDSRRLREITIVLFTAAPTSGCETFRTMRIYSHPASCQEARFICVSILAVSNPRIALRAISFAVTLALIGLTLRHGHPPCSGRPMGRHGQQHQKKTVPFRYGVGYWWSARFTSDPVKARERARLWIDWLSRYHGLASVPYRDLGYGLEDELSRRRRVPWAERSQSALPARHRPANC